MNNLDNILQEAKTELFKEKCVQEYFRYKEILNNDKQLTKLDKEMKKHQKLMCEKKENECAYQKEKTLYESYKKQIESNPIYLNYQIARDEVYSLLLDIKNVLS